MRSSLCREQASGIWRQTERLTGCFHSSDLAENRKYLNSLAHERHLEKKRITSLECWVDPPIR